MKLKFLHTHNYIITSLLKYRLYLGLKFMLLKYLNFNYFKGFRFKYSIFKLINLNILLKQSLKLIYDYHYLHNYIFFIGFPEKNYKSFCNIVEKSNNYFLFHKNWTTNLINNKVKLLENKKKKSLTAKNKTKLNILKSLFKNMQLKNKPNLIVFYNHNYKFLVMNEALSSNIPIVTFYNNSYYNTKEFNFNVLGNFQKIFSEKFLYFLLYTVLLLPKSKYKNNNKFFKKTITKQ